MPYSGSPETGFYYLQSRYYDPAVRRFLNADTLASTGQGFLGYNMFAYCNNNPTNMSDTEGGRPAWEQNYEGGSVGYTDAGTGKPLPKAGLANAPDLDVNSAGSSTYNCYGNAIKKKVATNPTGYKQGVSTRETFEMVVNDLGAANVRELGSISDPLQDDEYLVALKCGAEDYHFIRLTPDGWYNKSGLLPGCYVPQQFVENEIWLPMRPDQTRLGIALITPQQGGIVYDDETIYFAIKEGWDKS